MKDIPGFEGRYAVTKDGRVWSYARDGNQFQGRWLAHESVRGGYRRVLLTKHGKLYKKSVHRLVAQAYIENEKNSPQVNHINGIKTDNRVENLEWCSAKENVLHAARMGLRDAIVGSRHPLSKLNPDKVRHIREMCNKNGATFTSMATMFGITIRVASLVAKEKSWKHVL